MVKKYTLQEAREKIRRYCAYQERCHQEVRSKLYEYGLPRHSVDELLAELITEGFLNEERYARAFAGGKFRMKNWGRLKISHALEQKGLTQNCIAAGLSEINDEDYYDTLREVLVRKLPSLSDDNIFTRRHKLAEYAIRKGFEPELVWELVPKLLPDQPSGH